MINDYRSLVHSSISLFSNISESPASSKRPAMWTCALPSYGTMGGVETPPCFPMNCAKCLRLDRD